MVEATALIATILNVQGRRRQGRTVLDFRGIVVVTGGIGTGADRDKKGGLIMGGLDIARRVRVGVFGVVLVFASKGGKIGSEVPVKVQGLFGKGLLFATSTSSSRVLSQTTVQGGRHALLLGLTLLVLAATSRARAKGAEVARRLCVGATAAESGRQQEEVHHGDDLLGNLHDGQGNRMECNYGLG